MSSPPVAGARRELGAAVVLCLVGGALLLLGVDRDWVTLVVHQSAPLPDDRIRSSGATLVSGLPELAVVALAGVPALLATRRGGRLLVGGLLLVDGLVVLRLVLPVLPHLAVRAGTTRVGRGDHGGTAADVLTAPVWPSLCLVGGLLLVLAGALVLVRSRRWATLSGRYEVPAARAEQPPRPDGERATWDALDRGEDPTGS